MPGVELDKEDPEIDDALLTLGHMGMSVGPMTSKLDPILHGVAQGFPTSPILACYSLE